MSSLDRLIREMGLTETLHPAAQARQQQAAARVIDEAGRIAQGAADPFRTPLTMHWEPGSTGRQRTAQAVTAVVLAAHADTPPSSGNCIVTLTIETALMGSTVIEPRLSITNGSTIGEAQLNYPVPAGAWLGATVTTANGASGVSISLTLRVGS